MKVLEENSGNYTYNRGIEENFETKKRSPEATNNQGMASSSPHEFYS